MQAHHVMAAGLFAEIVKKQLRQPAQHLGKLRQPLADLHHLLRQFAHREAMLRFLTGGHVEIENIIQRRNQLEQLLAMAGEPLRIGQRRCGFRTKLLHAGGDQLAEQIQLQAKPGGGDLGAHLQRVAGDVRQMMAFIEDQQQVFRLRQHRFALHRRHHQRMVGHHHFRLLNFPPRHKERALAIVVAVAVQAAGLIGAQPAPQRVIDGFVGMVAQAVPAVAVEVLLQGRTQLLLGLVVRGEIVIEKGQQILL